jgi:hypothetical protein
VIGSAVLDRAGNMTNAVAVFVAAVRPDLTRLDEVAERVMAWHAPARVAGAGAAVR